MIDADPVAAGVRAIMEARTERTVWTGNASGLLGALSEVVGERVTKSKSWPDNPRALSGALRRAASFLRKIGIEITFGREGRARTRIITINTNRSQPAPENDGGEPSAPSAPSAPLPKFNPANGFKVATLRTVASDADGRGESRAPTVRVNPLKSNAGNSADGADANLAAGSGPRKTSAAGWSARL